MLAGLLVGSCAPKNSSSESGLSAVLDEAGGTIAIFRAGTQKPILVQNAKVDFRPYLHPIVAPDGQGEVTEYSPGHHKHQTGLYWGFTRVNGEHIDQDSVKKWFYRQDKSAEQKQILGRDYFHNPGKEYWRREDFRIIDSIGDHVRWQTIYSMLDISGKPILKETQTWTMVEQEREFLLDLEWKGEALVDITIGEYEYGGLFLRMPWRKGMKGEVVNFARQRNQRAEGQRAMWVDVGMQVEGRQDLAHVAIFDHPKNRGFPQTWRVDGQMGVGPVCARMGDWKISKGQSEIIQHQIVVYTGDLNDMELTEKWKQFIGDDNLYATAGLWSIAQEEGKAARFLTAQEAVQEMTIMEGYSVNVWASEPMITQPMAFCWDDRGRMWVAENRDYESRRDGFSGSGDSRILILEDTDHDGVADSRKVFAEGITFPSAIAVGFDGVFLAAPPNLLFVPDRNEDDLADMDDIEVRLTGWGIRDRHETINSFHWGPDGWLYGLEGFATPSKIRKPSNGGKLYRHNEPFPENLLEGEGVEINGGVWRYHPIKDRFEVVAHGFSNPWGIDYDAKGQLVISACVIPHLFHVIPGGIYHRQGGQHFNSYIYDDIKTIVNHRHRSAHGGARFYLSDAFSPDQQGRLFMANIHEHAVLSDILEEKGSGFVAHHGDDFMMANNAQWIGFSLEIGPAGNLYVLDWHDADICGNDVVQKETGRIFRITPDQSSAKVWEGRYEDLALQSDLRLAELQLSTSAWHARRARLILQNRATKRTIEDGALDELLEILQTQKEVDVRLRALWALHLIGELTKETMLLSLRDPEEYIRGWAVQLLCEDRNVSPRVLAVFEELAESDPSPVVRLYLAAALQRLPVADRWNLTTNLVDHPEDTLDHNIPKMIWFGAEALVETDIGRALDLAESCKIPVIAEFISRRLFDAGGLEQLVAALDTDSPNRLRLLQGLRSELENRPDLSAPANWSRVYSSLKSNRYTADMALEIAQLFGDAGAIQEMLAILDDPSATVLDRKDALTGLASRTLPDLKPQLSILLDDPVLRITAIRAIARYKDHNLGRLLYNKYRSFNTEEKTEAALTLASRPMYARRLANGIKSGQIPRSDIPAHVARQLRRVLGSGFVEIWGPIDDISSDLEAQYVKFGSLLTEDAIRSADPIAGKVIFQRACGVCHQMYGQGGSIGPDITGSNRTNTAYLLGNILEPSAEIQDDYKMVAITTRDGRTYLGNVAAENDRQLTLKVVGIDQAVISKSDIQSREDTPNSMMPPGLLSTLTDQEVLNLVAFLKTREPL